MKLTGNAFEQIRGWIYRNARPLDAARWRFHFERGSAQDVLSALSFYQNPDGGFGHALDADCWNPESTPYATLNAATLLRSVGLTSPDLPMLRDILNYFRSGSGFEAGQWLFTLPSNDGWPHAPWWHFDAATNACESAGLSAAVSAFLLDVVTPGDALFDTALSLASQAHKRMLTSDASGEMFLEACLTLLPHWKRLSITSEPSVTEARVHELVRQAITHAPEDWSGYVPRPSRYIHGPESAFCDENRALVEAELDYLIQTLPSCGVWPINWSWFQNCERYAGAFAISENWATAYTSLEKVLWLNAFDRIEA